MQDLPEVAWLAGRKIKVEDIKNSVKDFAVSYDRAELTRLRTNAIIQCMAFEKAALEVIGTDDAVVEIVSKYVNEYNEVFEKYHTENFRQAVAAAYKDAYDTISKKNYVLGSYQAINILHEKLTDEVDSVYPETLARLKTIFGEKKTAKVAEWVGLLHGTHTGLSEGYITGTSGGTYNGSMDRFSGVPAKVPAKLPERTREHKEELKPRRFCTDDILVD
jgi:hypothetical protein